MQFLPGRFLLNGLHFSEMLDKLIVAHAFSVQLIEWLQAVVETINMAIKGDLDVLHVKPFFQSLLISYVHSFLELPALACLEQLLVPQHICIVNTKV